MREERIDRNTSIFNTYLSFQKLLAPLKKMGNFFFCVCLLFTCSPLATVCFHAFRPGLMSLLYLFSVYFLHEKKRIFKCFSEASCELQCPKYTYILIDLTTPECYMLNKVRQMHAIKTVRLGRGNLNNARASAHTHTHARVACMLSEYKSVFSCRLL